METPVQPFPASTPRGSTPVPDPTLLTTQQLMAAISALKELVFTRLDGNDKAVELFNANLTRVPTDTDKQISHLKELHAEKFKAVQGQFLERDVRTDKIAELGQKALEAALSAAKEAVGKTEISFTKQIDATAAQIEAQKRAADDKFEDVKTRLGTLEASINTRQVVTTERASHSAWLIPMLVLGAIAILIPLILQMMANLAR